MEINSYGESRDRLVRMSGHLIYEFVEFRRLAQLNLAQSGDQRLKNIYLDSFVIHLRNLLDFFFFESPKGNCLSVRSFPPFDDVAGIATRPQKSSILDKAKRKSVYQVAHLHYKRLEYDGPDDKPWDVPKIACEIESLMLWFWKGVNRDFLNLDEWNDSLFSKPRLEGLISQLISDISQRQLLL